MFGGAVQRRNSTGNQRVGKIAPRGDAQPRVVEIGALAALGDVEIVGCGIVDEARDKLAVALEFDGNREDRQAVQKVGGAVERIDMPGMRFVGALDKARFFHDETVAGARPRKLFEQGLFGAFVSGSDEVARSLDRDLQVLDLAEIALQAAPGFERGRNHHIHQGGADHGNLGNGSEALRPCARQGR